ncbi:XRE family transcriptional regulator [Aquitalea sp. S1-19]|nr:XRE family transcriptional regulator [Aquitalea sp. S1-19]
MNKFLPSQHFGGLLKQLRTERKLSQEAFAERAGVHRNFVSLLERGINQPSLDTLFALADALEMDVAELIRRLQTHDFSSGERTDSDVRKV